MEFDVSTFILEIVNFLVLIWILQRLFYKPLLTMIAQRRQFIDDSLTDAKKLREEAEELRDLYENRQKVWEQDKQAAMAALHQQLEGERTKQMDKLRVELEEERRKANVTLNRQQQEHQQQVEKQALLNGSRFAGLLLQQAVGPELEGHLFDMLLDHFTVLPEACRLCLEALGHAESVAIKVTSVYTFSADQRQRLEQKFNALLDRPVDFQYFQDAALIAGVRLDIGDWVLHANLKHELAGFAEIAYESE
ncbi:MAG: F0F1 ATP synthase subunit delta [Methylosarcina sp.]